MIALRSPFVLPIALALGLLSRPAAAQPVPLAVAPGTVLRWPGSGVTRCLLEEREVPATGGECLFAIDLLHAAGTVSLSRERNGERESVTIRVLPFPYPVERIKLDGRYVNLSPRDLARAESEQKVMAQIFSRATPPLFSLPLAKPLLKTPKGKNFGRKRVFNGEERQPHGGIDYAVRSGSEVLAVEDGEVALVADHFFPGRIIVLDHGGGLFSTYIHLQKALVAEGIRVKRGERIGLSGATGRVSGPHLHFGIRWQGARVNPELLYGAPSGWPAVKDTSTRRE